MSGFVSRVAGRLRRSRLTTVAPSSSAAVAELLDRARKDWGDGEKERSLDSLRQALLLDPRRADLWFLSAQRSIELGRSDAAWDAVRSALDLAPDHLDALELLVEIVRVSGRKNSVAVAAVDTMGRRVAETGEKERGALDFFIPFKRNAAIVAMTESQDVVVRGTARLYAESRGLATYAAGALDGIPHDAQVMAGLLYNLGVGRVSVAAELAATVPTSALPRDAIRRAIRRQSAKENYQRVMVLCDLHLRVVPQDAWTQRVRDRAQERTRAVAVTESGEEVASAYTLMQEGFPFRHGAPAPRFAPSPDRVFYLLHNSLPYSSAGYATRSHGLLRELAQSWDITGVTRLGFPFDAPGHEDLQTVPEDDLLDGVPYRRLTTTRGRWRKDPIIGYVSQYAKAVVDLAATERPAIIHAASNHWNGLTAVEAGRALGIPSVYEVRGLWEVTRASRNPEWMGSERYRYMARMEADAAQGATRVIAITNGLRDEMIDRGVDPEKISVVPNGVDTQRFVPVERDADLAHRLGLNGKTVVGYVGSVLDYEGLDLLVKAVGRMAATRDDVHLLVVGDGAERERVEGLARDMGILGTVVTFTGRVPFSEVERYYSLIDIAPFPRTPLPVCELVSPLKPFEAMAMGKVVVASDVRALAEIVTDGVTGLLHAKGSVESLERVLTTLVDDPGLRARLGAEGRKWVVERRDWARLADDVSSIYREVLDSPLDTSGHLT